VTNRNLKEFTLSHVELKRRNSPIARCASATNAAGRDRGILN